MGTAGAFYANAASFFVVVIALLLMRASSPPAEPNARHFLTETQEGFSYIVSRPIILGLTVMEAVGSVFGLDHAMLTILASDVFRVGAAGLRLFTIGARSRRRDRLEHFYRHGTTAGSRQDSFRLGDPLWRRLRPVRYVAVLSDRAGIAHFRRRHGHHLGRLARHDSADVTPEKFRGRVMGVFQLSNRGLHPLGQTETGLDRPLIGAREATFAGGIIISVMTLLTVWRVPEIVKFRWDQNWQQRQRAARLRMKERIAD